MKMQKRRLGVTDRRSRERKVTLVIYLNQVSVFVFDA